MKEREREITEENRRTTQNKKESENLAGRFQCQGQQLKYIENWAIILIWKNSGPCSSLQPSDKRRTKEQEQKK